MLTPIVLALILPLVQSAPHRMVQPESVVWGPMSPGGLSTAIAEGDPARPGTITMLLKLRDGGWIPPHFHNVDKRLVVISGVLLMGHGDVLDPAAATPLPAGGVAVVPAGTRHFEGGRGETIVALIASGPMSTTMVKR